EPANAARGLGASGAVAAVMVVFAFHYPHQRVLLFFVLPMPIWAVVVLFIALSMAGVFGAGRDGVGHAVHLFGALFGVLYYQSGRRISALFSGWRDRSRRRVVRPQLRVVNPEPDDTPEPVGAA